MGARQQMTPQALGTAAFNRRTPRSEAPNAGHPLCRELFRWLEQLCPRRNLFLKFARNLLGPLDDG